ncbi:hypothetical protein BD779DRAFT_1466458 [Infundibulicybe gibba]|nr:hypothetical protein BD779DRAFT_1466458 [Infundibulicybe gibba]
MSASVERNPTFHYPSPPSSSSVQLSSIQSQDCSHPIPYHRTLRFYKEQRERRKALLNRTVEPITIRTHPSPNHHPPASTMGRAKQSLHHHPHIPPQTCLHSSYIITPFPSRHVLPGRPVFPRSKPEPDLYRKAITTRMQSTPEGQNILRMGPRLAVSIMSATLELERIVAAQSDRENGDPKTRPVNQSPQPLS